MSKRVKTTKDKPAKKRRPSENKVSLDVAETHGLVSESGTGLPSHTSENPNLPENLPDSAEALLSVLERQILRLCHVERADIHEVAATLNQVQGTEAWTAERVAATLSRARRKLERAGELEAARPDAYHAQETRERYDAIIADLRKELRGLADLPIFAGTRAKLLKTVADVEKMRDEVLLALAGKTGGAVAGALVYVSSLREGPIASVPARAIPAALADRAADKAGASGRGGNGSGVHPPGGSEQGRRGPPLPPNQGG